MKCRYAIRKNGGMKPKAVAPFLNLSLQLKIENVRGRRAARPAAAAGPGGRFLRRAAYRGLRLH